MTTNIDNLTPPACKTNKRQAGNKSHSYNLPNGNVNVENWLDPHNNNNWIKIGQFVDQGGSGEEGTKCGGRTDHVITWGSPMVTFRRDDISVDFRNLSVMEIEP